MPHTRARAQTKYNTAVQVCTASSVKILFSEIVQLSKNKTKNNQFENSKPRRSSFCQRSGVQRNKCIAGRPSAFTLRYGQHTHTHTLAHRVMLYCNATLTTTYSVIYSEGSQIVSPPPTANNKTALCKVHYLHNLYFLYFQSFSDIWYLAYTFHS